MQFPWNLQLLTRHCLFRNLPCPTTDLSTVEADRISEMLNTSSVTRTKVLDILNAFWQDNTCYWSSSQNFVVFMVRYFFLLNHFLVVEDYELSQSSSHPLNVLLTLEYVILIHLFSFYINCVPNNVLCKITIWADDTTLKSSCDKASDLSQQV